MDKVPVREACEVAISQEVFWQIRGTGDLIYLALVWFSCKFLTIIFADGIAECIFSYSPLEHESIQTQGHTVIIVDPGHVNFGFK